MSASKGADACKNAKAYGDIASGMLDANGKGLLLTITATSHRSGTSHPKDLVMTILLMP
jgi:hypothetical protein